MRKKSHLSFYLGPQSIALLVMVSGILNIVSALIASPWVNFVRRIIPIDFFDASRTLTVVSGILLLILSRGLFQRKHRAWVISIVILILSFFSNLGKGGDILEMVALLIPLGLLLQYRWEFTVRSVKLNVYYRFQRILLLAVIILAYIILGFSLLHTQFHEPVTVNRVVQNYATLLTGLGPQTLHAKTRRARWFEQSLFTLNVVFIGVLFASFFAPLIQNDGLDEKELQVLKSLTEKWGNFSTSYFSLLDDKKYFFYDANTAVVVYRICNGTAVALNEPLSPPELRDQVHQAFLSYCMKCGLSTVFYHIRADRTEYYEKMGMSLLKIGEEAVIHPSLFSLSGSSMKNIRNSLTHVEHVGVRFQSYIMSDIPGEVLVEIHSLHQEWLKRQILPQLSFSMDFYPFPFEKNGFVFTARNAAGYLECVLSFLPYRQAHAVSLDEMFRSSHATNGIVEATISRAILHLREHAMQEISLGMVALAHTHIDTVTPPLVQKGKTILYKHFNQLYNYKTLFTFKEKFQPEWEPRFIAFTGNAELVKAAISIIGVHNKKNMWFL